jgi:hypothetical protein
VCVPQKPTRMSICMVWPPMVTGPLDRATMGDIPLTESLMHPMDSITAEFSVILWGEGG